MMLIGRRSRRRRSRRRYRTSSRFTARAVTGSSRKQVSCKTSPTILRHHGRINFSRASSRGPLSLRRPSKTQVVIPQQLSIISRRVTSTGYPTWREPPVSFTPTRHFSPPQVEIRPLLPPHGRSGLQRFRKPRLTIVRRVDSPPDCRCLKLAITGCIDRWRTRTSVLMLSMGGRVVLKTRRGLPKRASRRSNCIRSYPRCGYRVCSVSGSIRPTRLSHRAKPRGLSVAPSPCRRRVLSDSAQTKLQYSQYRRLPEVSAVG